MTQTPFSYEDFEEQRERMINCLHQNLYDEDKQFLVEFTAGLSPWKREDWSIFPAIRWKQQNLSQLREDNPAKHQSQLEKLHETLFP